MAGVTLHRIALLNYYDRKCLPKYHCSCCFGTGEGFVLCLPVSFHFSFQVHFKSGAGQIHNGYFIQPSSHLHSVSNRATLPSPLNCECQCSFPQLCIYFWFLAQHGMQESLRIQCEMQDTLSWGSLKNEENPLCLTEGYCFPGSQKMAVMLAIKGHKASTMFGSILNLYKTVGCHVLPH